MKAVLHPPDLEPARPLLDLRSTGAAPERPQICAVPASPGTCTAAVHPIAQFGKRETLVTPWRKEKCWSRKKAAVLAQPSS